MTHNSGSGPALPTLLNNKKAALLPAQSALQTNGHLLRVWRVVTRPPSMPRCVLGVFLRDSAGVGEGAGRGVRGPRGVGAGLGCGAAGRPERRRRGMPGTRSPATQGPQPGRRGHGWAAGRAPAWRPKSQDGSAGERGWGGRGSPPRPLEGFPPASRPGRRGRRAGAALQPGLRRAPGRPGGASGPGGGAAAAGGPGGGAGRRYLPPGGPPPPPRCAQPWSPGRGWPSAGVAAG